MSHSQVTDEVALRIGLAVRVLPSMQVSLFVDMLIAVLGHPLTLERLSRLRLGRLKHAAHGLLDATSEEDLRQVLSLLKGRGIHIAQDPTPCLSPYREGDMPNSIRVACTSDFGEKLNSHFGLCSRFLIYQVAANESRLIEVRKVPAFAVEDDKNTKRAELISDCHLLYTTSIGGPAAAKVVRAGVHPIKVEHEIAAPELISQLQKVLQLPPPWLAKVMGEAPVQRIRFALSSNS